MGLENILIANTYTYMWFFYIEMLEIGIKIYDSISAPESAKIYYSIIISTSAKFQLFSYEQVHAHAFW